jgi:hypothetical protein
VWPWSVWPGCPAWELAGDALLLLVGLVITNVVLLLADHLDAGSAGCGPDVRGLKATGLSAGLFSLRASPR